MMSRAPNVDAFTEQQLELGLLVYDTALGGTPMQGHQMRWMQDVRVGDVVIGLTGWRHPWDVRIGTLIREYDELLFDDDGTTPLWRDDARTKQASIHHWILQTNTHEHDWHNEQFIRIPITKHERDLYRARGQRCIVASGLNCCARETWSESARYGLVQNLRASR